MFSKKIKPLRNTLLFRLTILYAGIFSLSTLLVLLLFYSRIHTVTMNALDTELLDEIQRYSSVLSEKGLEGLKAEIAVEGNREDPAEEFYRLLTLEGETVASTDISSWQDAGRGGSLARLKDDGTTPVFHTLTVPGGDYDARIISAIIGPGLVMQIGETLEDTEEYLQIFLKWFLLLLITGMVLSSIIGWFMAKRALLDMEDVTNTACEISKGAYTRRVEVKDRYEEIRRLGTAFNNMLDRIEKLLLSMKEVNANIAHDLRSPLTRIRGVAEMSLLHERSVDEYKGMAASTIEECDRLIDMINTMLELTETEAGITSPLAEELNIVKLLNDACELFRPIAKEKNIEIMKKFPANLKFRGDRKKFQRIISNLLDNAIKYTPEAGSITIAAKEGEEGIEIIFEDTGIGISETDLPHIFERFYRCDRSRPHGGVGLGLSLVKAFTEVMHGTISVMSTVNRGSRFFVQFPH